MILVNQLQVTDKKGNNLLNNISLRIPMGKIIGLTGPSGAGKTTLVNTILGILSEDLKVSSGTITIDDFDILEKDNINSNNRNIAFIPVSYTHLTLPTTCTRCRSRWSPYH